MRLFTQDSNNQFRYIGDYDMLPVDRRGLFPVSGGGKEPSPLRLRARRYSKTILGLILGLIVGILFLSIGFFETLLLAILMAIGFVIGGFFDRNPIVMKFLSNLG